SVSLVPAVLLEGKTVPVTMETGNFKNLHMLLDGGNTTRNKLGSDLLKISKTINDLYDIFNLDSQDDKNILREEYTTSEVYIWDGQHIFVNNGEISEK